MPVYLRNFYYKKLVDAKEKEKEEIDKAKKKQNFNKPNLQSSRFRR
tara:strand:+ start:11039 stop:11176 length:138 start_codon:yes stop_codon:yes gene_type:complete